MKEKRKGRRQAKLSIREKVEKFILENPQQVHYFSMFMLDGSEILGKRLFLAKILEFFIPGTLRGDELQIHLFRWEGAVWQITSFSERYKMNVDKIAKSIGFKIFRGLPEQAEVPLLSEETMKKRGNTVYELVPKLVAELSLKELKALKEIEMREAVKIMLEVERLENYFKKRSRIQCEKESSK